MAGSSKHLRLSLVLACICSVAGIIALQDVKQFQHSCADAECWQQASKNPFPLHVSASKGSCDTAIYGLSAAGDLEEAGRPNI